MFVRNIENKRWIMTNTNKINILEKESIRKLIFKFSIPAIVGGLINALYNIADQIFIGQKVGVLGNAATNVAFPITTFCIATMLLLSVGTASNFSISLGKKHEEEAKTFLGNGILALVIFGVVIAILTLLFLEPLLYLCGATEASFPYAYDYVKITAIGYPFMIFSSGIGNLIRADGDPVYAMNCILVGAILNVFLDPLFIFVFDMGIKGGAYATVIGQIVSTIIAIKYLTRFKSVKLEKKYIKISLKTTWQTAKLGVSPFINQMSMMITQIVLNNVVAYYGALSKYGSDIPLASVGIITKITTIVIMIAVGIAQGSQPIIGYNYGAARYDRVRETYRKNFLYVTIISVIFFALFQIFPREITSIFGDGSPEYFEFSEKYFRIFMFMTFINGIQPITGNFFSSIGKAILGAVIGLTRQIIFLLPLVIILPRIYGIDVILYAGPIADFSAFAVSVLLISREFKILKKMEREKEKEEELAFAETTL